MAQYFRSAYFALKNIIVDIFDDSFDDSFN